MTTFAELGIEFPLFAATVEEASGWAPTGRCEICSEERAGFTIGIGDHVDQPCPHCAVMTPLPADGEPETCIGCGALVALGRVLEDAHGCWRCLREGRWSTTIDTEAGMVTPVHAALGRTHGMPFRPDVLPQFGTDDHGEPTLAGWPVGDSTDGGWRVAVIPSDVLLALVRSPGYITYQSEQWLFHCRQPMRYLGPWGKRDFETVAEGGAEALAMAVVDDLHDEAWEDLHEIGGEGSVLIYMFECVACGTNRGHWDCD